MKISTIIFMLGVIVVSISESQAGIKYDMWQFWGIMIGWWAVYAGGLFAGRDE